MVRVHDRFSWFFRLLELVFPSQTTHNHAAASEAIVHGVPVRFNGDHIAKVSRYFSHPDQLERVARCSVHACGGTPR